MAAPPALPAWFPTVSPSFDALCGSQNSYAGRDKAVRTLAFWAALQAQKSTTHGKEWLALSKQCSVGRLVFRQFNHPLMIKSIQGLLKKAPEDQVEKVCTWTTVSAYTVFGFIELGAWLADAKIITADAAKLFRICLYLWFVALLAGIVKQLRILSRKGFEKFEKIKDDLLLLGSYLCDFVCAGNSMPAGLLWSGRFAPSTTVRLSLVASLIGLYRTF